MHLVADRAQAAVDPIGTKQRAEDGIRLLQLGEIAALLPLGKAAGHTAQPQEPELGNRSAMGHLLAQAVVAFGLGQLRGVVGGLAIVPTPRPRNGRLTNTSRRDSIISASGTRTLRSIQQPLRRTEMP